MDAKQVRTYLELNEEFNKQCEKIAEKMKVVDKNYAFVDRFYVEYGTVWGSSEEYSCGEKYSYNVSFDPILLTYSDEELDLYVKTLYDKKLYEEKMGREWNRTEQILKTSFQKVYNKMEKELGL